MEIGTSVDIKTYSNLDELLRDAIKHNCLLAEGLDSALFGIYFGSKQPLAVYEIEKCIRILQKEGRLGYLDAYEHFYYNILNTYLGESTPLYISSRSH